MREVARIPLPPHGPDGEFDHAAVDFVGDRLYVAHPTNDAVEVVDLAARRYRGSLSGLRGVAGVWVDAESRLLFTSNRGEDTASVFRLEGGEEEELFRVPTGARPNGMAFDPHRKVLMVAGVGTATAPDAPPTLTFIDVQRGNPLGQVRVPGRTRWALYHPRTDSFYVNIADPPSIVAIRAGEFPATPRRLPVAAWGPHGLEQDPDKDLLYCACDEGSLVTVELPSGSARSVVPLSGAPDVLWLNRDLGHLYCAIGEPGVIDVFQLGPAHRTERTDTAAGAHTLTVDPRRNEVHVFAPGSHEDIVLTDGAA